MKIRPSARPSRVPRLALHATYVTLGLATAVTLSGCPDGAELEAPDRFIQYGAGTGGTATTGGSAGVGGATGGTAGTGTGGATGGSAGAGAGTGGAAGGGAGTGAGTWVWNCPDGSTAESALKQNCARASCHNATSHWANLDLTDPNTIKAQMVDVVALHGGINCAPAGMPVRECTAEELVAKGCPTDAKLIDSANFDASWVLKKFDMTHGTCGLYMPYPPGNSATSGWNDMRKQCYVDFFRSLATSQ